MQKQLFAILVTGFIAACQNQGETHKVSTGTLNEAVYASGEIMPYEYEFLYSTAPDRVMKLMVREGDTVKPGQILAILGTSSENRQLSVLGEQVAQARLNAREDEAALTGMRTRLDLARIRYHQDSLNAVRYESLVKDQAVSEKEAENYRIQAEASRAELMDLQQQYRSLKSDLNNKILVLEQELARLMQSRENKVLTSRLHGKVYNINMLEGELAQPHEPVMMVGSAEEFKLELLVDERDINRIKPGQKVYFETDAFAGRQFEASVSKIVPVLQKETRSFEVEARVSNHAGFYPRSSVEANITIRENAEALIIPIEFIFEGDTVLLEREGEIDKVKVGTGVRNGAIMEVINGLNQGDIIHKSN